MEGFGRTAASSIADVDDGWLQKQIIRSGDEIGGFTETQLREELGVKTTTNRRGMPQGSATVAWWVDRQNDVQARLKDRKGGAGAGANNDNNSNGAGGGDSRAAAAGKNGAKGGSNGLSMNVLQAFAPKRLPAGNDNNGNANNGNAGGGSGGPKGKKAPKSNKLKGGGGIIGLVGLKGKGK